MRRIRIRIRVRVEALDVLRKIPEDVARPRSMAKAKAKAERKRKTMKRITDPIFLNTINPQ